MGRRPGLALLAGLLLVRPLCPRQRFVDPGDTGHQHAGCPLERLVDPVADGRTDEHIGAATDCVCEVGASETRILGKTTCRLAYDMTQLNYEEPSTGEGGTGRRGTGVVMDRRPQFAGRLVKGHDQSRVLEERRR